MLSNPILVQGTLKPDGTLELDEKPKLPPGRVQVTVQPLPLPLSQDPFWQMMERIWADQKARGEVPRTKEEIDADIQELRDEAEEQMNDIENLQEQIWRERGQRGPSQEPAK